MRCVKTDVERYGDDGTWSAISLRVGTPPQWIDVMVSTVSSETWIVGTGACKLTGLYLLFLSLGSFAGFSLGHSDH